MASILPGRSIGASRVALRIGDPAPSFIRFAMGSFISSQRSITLIISIGASGRRSLSAIIRSSAIVPSFDGVSFVAKRASFIVFPFPTSPVCADGANARADRQLRSRHARPRLKANSEPQALSSVSFQVRGFIGKCSCHGRGSHMPSSGIKTSISV
jgi:hypothetical protein